MRVYFRTTKLTRMCRPWLVTWCRAGTYRYNWLRLLNRQFYLVFNGFCHHRYQDYSYTRYKNGWKYKQVCGKCGKVKFEYREELVDVENILARFAYREGSRFSVETVDNERCIVLRTPNVCADTGRTDQHIMSWRSLSEFNLKDEEDFKRDVLMLCYQQEMHEAQEFLKFDGARPFNPHKGKYSAYNITITWKGK